MGGPVLGQRLERHLVARSAPQRDHPAVGHLPEHALASGGAEAGRAAGYPVCADAPRPRAARDVPITRHLLLFSVRPRRYPGEPDAQTGMTPRAVMAAILSAHMRTPDGPQA